MKTDIFIPCCIDQYSPQTGFNMLKILEKLGVETKYNPSQTCCGEQFYRRGDFESAKKLSAQFMDLFQTADYIVGASASCISFVRHFFEDLFFNSSYHNRYKQFANKSYEFSDFLVNILQKTDVGAVFRGKAVVVEDRGIKGLYNVRKELLSLLSQVKELEVIPVSTEVIQGSDLMFINHFEPISTEIVRSFVDEIQMGGADTIISNDYKTLLNLDSFIKKQAIPIKCVHIIDVLANE